MSFFILPEPQWYEMEVSKAALEADHDAAITAAFPDEHRGIAIPWFRRDVFDDPTVVIIRYKIATYGELSSYRKA